MLKNGKCHFLGQNSKFEKKWWKIIILVSEPLFHNPDCTSIPKWPHFCKCFRRKNMVKIVSSNVHLFTKKKMLKIQIFNNFLSYHIYISIFPHVMIHQNKNKNKEE